MYIPSTLISFTDMDRAQAQAIAANIVDIVAAATDNERIDCYPIGSLANEWATDAKLDFLLDIGRPMVLDFHRYLLLTNHF